MSSLTSMKPARQTARLRLGIDDVLDLIGEMAGITSDFARDDGLDERTRVGAAMATANIVAKAVPALQVRLELIANERRAASLALGVTPNSERDPFRRIRQVEASETLRRHTAAIGGPDHVD